jgi:hypothetical protein
MLHQAPVLWNCQAYVWQCCSCIHVKGLGKWGCAYSPTSSFGTHPTYKTTGQLQTYLPKPLFNRRCRHWQLPASHCGASQSYHVTLCCDPQPATHVHVSRACTGCTSPCASAGWSWAGSVGKVSIVCPAFRPAALLWLGFGKAGLPQPLGCSVAVIPNEVLHK